MNIDEMPAGREMDALVAERVMGIPAEKWDPPCAAHHRTDDAERDPVLGWSGWCYSCGKPIDEVAGEPAHYSTDIAAAFEVLERLAVCQPYIYRFVLPDRWRVQMDANTEPYAIVRAEADTAPLAICRAALGAVAP